jgi:hypothetical protein
MFRTIQALGLVGGLLVLVGQGFAQEPVTERPGQVKQQSAPQQAVQQPAAPRPAPTGRLLVTLDGHEEYGSTGKLTFQIYDTGKVVMIDSANVPVTGKIQLNGQKATISFNNCVYECTENNNVLSGRARFTAGSETGKSWNFRVAARNTLVSRTFEGQETLKGYGSVTFRFVNGSTVEMIDRDGTTRGSYTNNGFQVVMTFGEAVYNGQLRGDSVAGTAHNTRGQWTFAIAASR